MLLRAEKKKGGFLIQKIYNKNNLQGGGGGRGDKTPERNKRCRPLERGECLFEFVKRREEKMGGGGSCTILSR